MSFTIVVSLRRRPVAVWLDIVPSTADLLPFGDVLFDRPGAVLHGCHSTISGTQDISPDAVLAWRLLLRDAWPGTWLRWPVAALVSPGDLPVRRRRRRRLLGWSYDVLPDTVVSRRLLGPDVWPGTWPWQPVAALLSPGDLPVRRQRRRRLVGTSWWWWWWWSCGGTFNGSIVLRVLREASGDGGGAGGGVRGRLNSYFQ